VRVDVAGIREQAALSGFALDVLAIHVSAPGTPETVYALADDETTLTLTLASGEARRFEIEATTRWEGDGQQVPAFSGVVVQDIAPGNGAVAGRALGCDGEPLENAQVVVRDADCHVSTDAYTGYFTNQLPDLFRTSTSADGVFAVLNVPPGDYTVELYAPVPGRAAEDPQPHVRAGSATLTLEADGATVVDLQLGHDDGLFYPAACSSCP
jgi:hypothetical protein